MSRTHRPTSQQYTTNLYRTLTIAILPLTIYFLQLLGKASFIAACASGLLVVLKVVLEWVHHRAPRHHMQQRLVRTQTITNCYLCGKQHSLSPHDLGSHHIDICQRCQDCIAFTEQYA